MAKNQYRWFGTSNWQAQSGNAIVALINKNNSGKKITVKTFEIYQNTIGTPTTSMFLNLVRGTTTGSGERVSVTPYDTANTLPDGIDIYKDCNFTGNDAVLAKYMYFSSCIPTSAFGGFQARWGSTCIKGCEKNSLVYTTTRDDTLEDITINVGETVGIALNNQGGSIPIQINFVLVVDNKTYSGETISIPGTGSNTNNISYATSPLVISNTSASSIIRIKSISVTNIGTIDTPYLQLVPLGGVDPQSQADTTAKQSIVKFDTNSPDLDDDEISIILNAPCLPFGVPQEYITPGSSGTPKGFNYLHTKDFNGPTFFNYFPEYNSFAPSESGTLTDNRIVPKSNKQTSLIGKYSPIIIREGESIGLVSGAETAVGVTVVGTSGWMSLAFAITFTVENAYTPYLTLTGLQNGTDVVITESGTTDVLYSSYNTSGGSTSWQYDYDLVSSVDINIIHQEYKIIRYENLTIDQFGLTLPISQQSDRNYQE